MRRRLRLNKHHHVRCEVESGAKVEFQARLLAEAKFKQAEEVLQVRLQGELQEQRQRSEEELAKREEKLRALETAAEGKAWQSTWCSGVVRLEYRLDGAMGRRRSVEEQVAGQWPT